MKKESRTNTVQHSILVVLEQYNDQKPASNVQFSKSSFPKPVLQTKSPVLQTMTHLCPVLQISSVLQTNRKNTNLGF